MNDNKKLIKNFRNCLVSLVGDWQPSLPQLLEIPWLRRAGGRGPGWASKRERTNAPPALGVISEAAP